MKSADVSVVNFHVRRPTVVLVNTCESSFVQPQRDGIEYRRPHTPVVWPRGIHGVKRVECTALGRQLAHIL